MASSPPLLSSPSPPRRPTCAFVDDSTECAICFDAFADAPARPVLTLGCGHRWHLDCLVRQIEVGSMTASNDDQRLLFHACQCGKCGTIFGEDDHPDLPRDVLRSTDKLLRKVNALIDEHNLLEEVHVDGGALPTIHTEARYKEARRRYAFYLCSHCKDPYFGGTVACADGVHSASDNGGGAAAAAPAALPRETRLCPACAPQSQTICRNPSEHGRYLVWKCRYCCQPSTTVCYGNVHFCDECHGKNSALGGRKRLAARPCPGAGACPYPRPPPSSSAEETGHDGEGRWCHANGPAPDCEQVYSCALCASLGGGAEAAGDPLAIEAGSRNFLANPSGRDGVRGWRQLNPRMSWQVEGAAAREQQAIPRLLQTPVLTAATNDGATRERPPVTTNFVSSFLDCAMAQTVDLTEVLRIGRHRREGSNHRDIPRTVRIDVSARYTGRTDCPSVFALQAVLSDGDPGRGGHRGPPRNPRQQRQPAQRRDLPLPPRRLSSGTLEAPPGIYWERTALEFVLDTAAPQYDRPAVTVIVTGKDRRFWQGQFGSKVADVAVRVVGLTPPELEALLVAPHAPGAGRAAGDGDTLGDHRETAATREEEKKPASRWVMVVLFGMWLSWWWHSNDGSSHRANIGARE